MKVVLCIVVLMIACIAGCQANDVICNKPYIRVGTSCCLDSDANSICDIDEVAGKQEKMQEIQHKELAEEETKNIKVSIENESEFIRISKTHCQDAWPDDFQMRVYCEKQQKSAYSDLLKPKPDGLTQSVYDTVKTHCHDEWPSDFRMRAYCEKTQIDGYEELMTDNPDGISSSDYETIKTHCRNEWPRDYRMQAYCERKQLEGWEKLQ